MSTTVAPDPETRTKRAKAATSDRSRAENRLGMRLVAPAVIMMLLVTGWPMIAGALPVALPISTDRTR